MEKQKKIALINDLTGFGRCSTAALALYLAAAVLLVLAVR